MNDHSPESSRKVSGVPLDTETKPKHDSIFDQNFCTGRDAMEKSLKRNIDNMLDAIYSPTGADLETVKSVSSAFHLINEMGAQIGRRRVSTTEGWSSEDDSTEDSEESL